MDIPIGVLFAGALPEPQGVSPLAGPGSQAAVTDFRSKLLASLQTTPLPFQVVQSSPGLVPGASRSSEVAPGAAAMAGGPAPVVVDGAGVPVSAEAGMPVVGLPLPAALGLSAHGSEVPSGQTGPAAPPVGMRPPMGAAHQTVKRWGGACEPDPELTGSTPPDAARPGERAAAALASGADAASAAAPAVAAGSPQEAQPPSEQGEVAEGGEQGLRVPVERRRETVPPGRRTAPGGPLAPLAVGREAAGSAQAVQQGGRESHPGVQGVVRPGAAARVGGERAVPDGTSQTADKDRKDPGVAHSARRVDTPAVSVAFGPSFVGGGGAEAGVSQPSDGHAEGAAVVGKKVAEAEGDGRGSVEPVSESRVARRAGDAVAREGGELPQAGEAGAQAPRDEGGSYRDGQTVEPGVPGREAGRGEDGFELNAEEKATPWGTGVRDVAGDGREPIPGPARRVAARESAEGSERAEVGGRLARAAFELPGAIVARARVEAPQSASERLEGTERVASARVGELGELMPRFLVHQARLAGRGEAAELRVRLHPPELGEIRVSFRSEGGELRGAVAVERQEVRGWVESQVPRWRADLSEAGLRVSRLEVALLPRGGDGGWSHAMAWDGAGADRWGGDGPRGFGPAGAAPEVEVEAAELGVNAAVSRGGLDYWA